MRLTPESSYKPRGSRVFVGANRVPMPPRTEYRRRRSRHPVRGGILFAGSRGGLADRAREQSTDPIRVLERVRTETPTATSFLGVVMRARTKYRRTRLEKLAANKVPTIAAANRVPMSTIESSFAASLSELSMTSGPTADPSPTYFVAERGVSDVLRAACGSRQASESQGTRSSSLLLFTIRGTRDFGSVVTLRTGMDIGVRTGELLGELSTCPSIRASEGIGGADLASKSEQSTDQRGQSTELVRTECRIAIEVHAHRVGTLFAPCRVLDSCG